jgi:hypothetical protein
VTSRLTRTGPTLFEESAALGSDASQELVCDTGEVRDDAFVEDGLTFIGCHPLGHGGSQVFVLTHAATLRGPLCVLRE